MAVSYIGASSVMVINGNTVVSVTFTVSGGTNRALIALLGWQEKAVNVSSIVWDDGGTNQSFGTVLADQAVGSTYGRVAVYGLVAPTSGTSLTFTATMGSAVTARAVIFECNGVDQTGGTTSFPNANTGVGTTGVPTLTITSATGNLTTTMAAMDQANLSTPTQTQIFLNTTSSQISEGGQYASGAATVVHAWASDTYNWVMAGCDILAAGGGGGGLGGTWPGGTLKEYNGSTWVHRKIKEYESAAWNSSRGLKRWNGSAWLLINTTGR